MITAGQRTTFKIIGMQMKNIALNTITQTHTQKKSKFKFPTNFGLCKHLGDKGKEKCKQNHQANLDYIIY